MTNAACGPGDRAPHDNRAFGYATVQTQCSNGISASAKLRRPPLLWIGSGRVFLARTYPPCVNRYKVPPVILPVDEHMTAKLMSRIVVPSVVLVAAVGVALVFAIQYARRAPAAWC